MSRVPEALRRHSESPVEINIAPDVSAELLVVGAKGDRIGDLPYARGGMICRP
jgi:hypothetical protein